MTNHQNCFLLNLQQDRIMDDLILKHLGILTVRQRFPTNKVWVVSYDRNGKKLNEGFEP